MKKIFLLGASLAFFSLTYAQKAKFKEATKALEEAQKFQLLKNPKAEEEIIKAKDAIELASKDESTAKDYETWYYKASIYGVMQDFPAFASQQPYHQSYEAIKKALEIDKKKTLGKPEARQLIANNGFYFFNDGVNKINSSDYANAVTHFDNAYELLNVDEGKYFKDDKRIDTIKADALMMGGIAAYYANDFAGSAKRLERVVSNPIKANESSVYLNLSNAYGKLGKKTEQLATIEKGKKLFPTDPNMNAAEINYYIDAGESDKVIEKLKSEISANPNRDDYYSNLALAYLELVNRKKGTAEELEYRKLATTNFNKAADLKSDNPDYQYFSGISAYNLGESISETMNKTSDNKKYAELQKERDAIYKSALPRFQKLIQLYAAKTKAKSTNSELGKWEQAYNAMANIYSNLDDMDSYKKIKEERSKFLSE